MGLCPNRNDFHDDDDFLELYSLRLSYETCIEQMTFPGLIPLHSRTLCSRVLDCSASHRSYVHSPPRFFWVSFDMGDCAPRA